MLRGAIRHGCVAIPQILIPIPPAFSRGICQGEGEIKKENVIK
jgi:hypothetical protein